MKNIRQDFEDSLRPEYRRSDFGELTTGKYATVQVEFAQLIQLLLTCVGEDEGLVFMIDTEIPNSKPKAGDWTYEIDSATRITLRYWVSNILNITETIVSPPLGATFEDRATLQTLLRNHLQVLKAKVDAL